MPTENEISKRCELECFENEFVDLIKGLPLKVVNRFLRLLLLRMV